MPSASLGLRRPASASGLCLEVGWGLDGLGQARWRENHGWVGVREQHAWDS